MEVFQNAADLIGLDNRVRLELEEPDYEHIFYVTAKLHDRLVPLDKEVDKYTDLGRQRPSVPRGPRAAARRQLRSSAAGADRRQRAACATACMRLKGKGLHR